MKGIVGGERPSVSVTYFCAFAASRSENVCASSVSVLTRAMALSNSSIALSKFPLKQRKEKRLQFLYTVAIIIMHTSKQILLPSCAD